MQTDDLIQWLIVRGVTDKRIALFDADLGVSGTKRIDERTGLQELVEKIKQGKIRAVLVYQISRLFRDETGVQYNVFADVCKQNNCLLVTSDGMIFNFRNSMHLKMFRFLAEMAAEYIPQHIHLLHEARERKARKGLYAGMGTVPRGLVVDYGENSKTYGKYLVYRPHADIVLSLFERFYELDGSLNKLCDEQKDKSVVFPDFDETIDTKNRKKRHWKKVEGGYHISRHGLISLLTNPVYIGWWIVKGDIISRDNHERVIPKDKEYLFWFAFNCLAEYTIKGELNDKRKTPKRFYQKGTTPREGLLKDRITGTESVVYVHIQRDFCVYRINDPVAKVDQRYGAQVEVRFLDQAFLDRFFDHLRSVNDFDNYRQYVKEAQEQKESTTSLLISQLQKAECKQSEIVDEILSIRQDITKQLQERIEQDPLLDPEKVRKQLEEEYAPILRELRKRSASLESTKEELQKKLEEVGQEREADPVFYYADFHTELEKLIKVWHKKAFKEKQDFINLFVQKAVFSAVAPHWIQLDIYWKLPGWESESLFIHRRGGQKVIWTKSEKEIVTQHYASTNRETLLSLLPNKTWNAIKKEAARQKINRGNAASSCFIPEETSWQDYQFTQKMGVDTGVRSTICVPLS
jgi:DNA invertase Pin-like site-specific DNA recombinase